MKKLLGLLLVTVCALMAQFQSQSFWVDLFVHHPDSVVSRDLNGWISSGKVEFRVNHTGGLFASAEALPGKGEKVVLWFDPNGIVPTLDPRDAYILSQIEAVHEAVRIRNHLNGQHKMPPLAGISETPKVEAQRVWNSEWGPVNAEWALSKKLGKPNLMPIMNRAMKEGETPSSFLEGFYNLRMNNVGPKPALGAEFMAIYKREKAKLVVKR